MAKQTDDMVNNPFKVGDRVYVYPNGWMTVTGTERIIVTAEKREGCKLGTFAFDYRFASFTEYDPINGGLSHERPKRIAGRLSFPKELFDDIDYLKDYFYKYAVKSLAEVEKQINDVIPAEAAARNLKALEYIKKLLHDGYDITENRVGVENLGDTVDVSLTFTKHPKAPEFPADRSTKGTEG